MLILKDSDESARNCGRIALIVFAGLALMGLYAWGVPSAKEKTMAKADHIRTSLDGKEVMVISGSNNYRIGRVVRNGAFMARGRLTLTMRTRDGEYLFATRKQVQTLESIK